MDEELEVDIERAWEGKGQHLHDAIDDAWNNAKKGGAGPGTFEVQRIVIEAENPIRGYIVVIGPGG